MSKNARFRYSLQPVLLTRQWELDELRSMLGNLNQTLETVRGDIERLQEEMASVAQEWKQQSTSARQFGVGHFSIVAHYVNDIGVQKMEREKKLAELEQERDELIEKVVTSQRGVEAVENHRDQMQAEFLKAQASEACKLADDQWSILQGSAVKHGN